MPKRGEREELVLIDRDALDLEWMDQPRLIRKFTRLEADARFDLDEAEAALKLVEAQLLLDIRGRPDRYGFEKRPTDATVKAAVITQKKYQRAVHAVNEAKHIVGLMASGSRTASHRKTALEKLVDLEWMDYRSEPKTRNQDRMAKLEEVRRQHLRRPLNKDADDDDD